MEKEHKQLLLKDLSARLPYGVKILQGGVIIETLQSICKVGDDEYTVNALTNDMYNGFSLEQVKPYLRPMSSITEDESRGLSQLIRESWEFFDWLNANHFDYRGLIPLGLAIEATEDTYKK